MRRSTAVVVLSFAGFLKAQDLPPAPAETLTGQKVEFPSAARGASIVCVLAFSHEAGDKYHPWMDALARDGFNAWAVVNIEAAPALVRGMIRASLRKNTPQPQQSRTLVVTRDAKLWKQALKVGDDKLPVVALLDEAGRVLWTQEALYTPEVYEQDKPHIQAARRGGDEK